MEKKFVRTSWLDEEEQRESTVRSLHYLPQIQRLADRYRAPAVYICQDNIARARFARWLLQKSWIALPSATHERREI